MRKGAILLIYPIAGVLIGWASTGLGPQNDARPEQRSGLLESKATEWAVMRASPRPWIDAASTPEIREQIRLAASQGLYTGQAIGTLPVIEDLPDAEVRLQLLENLKPYPQLKNNMRALNSADEKALRGKLVAWGADPKRTEAIISRYKAPAKP